MSGHAGEKLPYTKTMVSCVGHFIFSGPGGEYEGRWRAVTGRPQRRNWTTESFTSKRTYQGGDAEKNQPSTNKKRKCNVEQGPRGSECEVRGLTYRWGEVGRAAHGSRAGQLGTVREGSSEVMAEDRD